MSPTEIQKALRAQPFIPFILKMSDGGTFPVYHPELCVVTTRLTVVAQRGGINSAVPEQIHTLDNIHITRMEWLIPAESPASSNGVH